VAARLEIQAAQGAQRQAGLLIRTNPTVEWFSDGGSGNRAEAVIGQELEIFGQQFARRSAGQAGVARARADVGNRARLVVGQSDRLFYRLVAAGQKAALGAEVAQLNRRLVDVVRRQLEAGEVSRLDFNLASIELGRAEARNLALQRHYEEITFDFAWLLGLSRATRILPVWDSTPAPSSSLHLDEDSLTARALARRPDLAEREAASRQASAEATAAAREALPALTLRVMTEMNAAGTERSFRPGLGVSVPLFNRNRGTVAEQRALARQAELERAALSSRIRTDVARAVSSYARAAASQSALETSVLPAARENRGLLEIAYREGKVGLPVLLLIRNQVIEAELEYWDAWLAAREALVELSETTGGLPAETLEIQ
jgi:cobalt-zinc-cadmium efflux system outer membrane protein